MNDNVSVFGGCKTENKVEEKKVGNKPLVSVGEGLSHFFIGAGLALGSFIVAYVLSLLLFDLKHYICITLSTIFVSYLFINAYDYATAKQPTLKAGPVKNFTILFSFIILVIGYNNYGQNDFTNLFSENKTKTENIIIGEQKAFGIVKHNGEMWTTNSTPKKRVVIKIRGAAAIVNDEKLLTGDYAICVPDDGIIKVVGTKEITTSIEVVE